MFHTILTLTYLIPNIYLFTRLMQLFIRKEHLKIFIPVYLLLFMIYPASRLIDGDAAPVAGKLLSSVSDYMLPFFLYLFLFTLLYDLLLLINIPLKAVPREKIRSRSFRNVVFAAIVFCSAVVLTAGIINFNVIRTREYGIEVEGKQSGKDHLTIAFVSDFHLHRDVNTRFVGKFVRKISSIRPDILLYGGDIIDGDSNDERIREFERLLSGTETRYGSYGVLGNHERYSRNEDGAFFRNSGITLLTDSAVVVDGSFVVAGRYDSSTQGRLSVSELMKNIPDSLPVILLDHRPTSIDEISTAGADLALSGHTHHGQLFPINFITRKVYELSYGYLKKGNTHFFVSSGIRLWGPPVRTTAKSEILIVNVTFR